LKVFPEMIFSPDNIIFAMRKKENRMGIKIPKG